MDRVRAQWGHQRFQAHALRSHLRTAANARLRVVGADVDRDRRADAVAGLRIDRRALGIRGGVGIVRCQQLEITARAEDATGRKFGPRLRVGDVDRDGCGNIHASAGSLGVWIRGGAGAAHAVVGRLLIAEITLLGSLGIRRGRGTAARRALRARCACRCHGGRNGGADRTELHIAAGGDVPIGGGERLVVGDRECKGCPDGRILAGGRAARAGEYVGTMRRRGGHRPAGVQHCASIESGERSIVAEGEGNCGCHRHAAARGRTGFRGDVGAMKRECRQGDVRPGSGGTCDGIVFNFGPCQIVGDFQRERCADADIPATSTPGMRSCRGGGRREVRCRQGNRTGAAVDHRILFDHRFGAAVFDVDRDRARDADVLAAAARQRARSHRTHQIESALAQRHRRHAGFDAGAFGSDLGPLADARLRVVVAEVERNGRADADRAAARIHRGTVGGRRGIGIVGGFQGEFTQRADHPVRRQLGASLGVGDIDRHRRSHRYGTIGGLGLRIGGGAGTVHRVVARFLVAEVALLGSLGVRRIAAAARACALGTARTGGSRGSARRRGQCAETHITACGDVAIGSGHRLVVGHGERKGRADGGILACRGAADLGDYVGAVQRDLGQRAADRHGACARAKAGVRVVVLDRDRHSGCYRHTAVRSGAGFRGNPGAVQGTRSQYHVARRTAGGEHSGVLDFRARAIVGKIERERRADPRIPADAATVERMRARHICCHVLRQKARNAGTRIDDRPRGNHCFRGTVFDIDRHGAGNADVLAARTGQRGRAHAVGDVVDPVPIRDGSHQRLQTGAFRMNLGVRSHAGLRGVVAEIQRDRRADANLAVNGGTVGRCVRIGVVAGLQEERPARGNRAIVRQRRLRPGIRDIDAHRRCDGNRAIGSLGVRIGRGAGIADTLFGSDLIAEAALVIGLLVRCAAR